MYIQCLGSGDAFGSGGRFNTSFYIRTVSGGMLLDCGASTLIALKRENLSTEDVDAIAITHLHGDHFGGLAFLLCEISALGTRRKPLTIIGPPDTEKRTLQSLQALYPGVKLEGGPEIKFMQYTANTPLRWQQIEITAYEVIHTPETHPHALRIQADGRTIAYSGDTEWSDNLLKVSADADLFLCEATELHVGKKHHLSVDEVTEKLGAITAKKVVLTHLSKEALDHLNEINLTVAGDGDILLND